MADDDKPLSAEELAKLKPVDAPLLFATSFQHQTTGNEVTILFQRPRPLEDGLKMASTAKLEVVAGITMSPQSFKDLSIVMGDILTRHEQEFGVLETAYTRRRAEEAAKK